MSKYEYVRGVNALHQQVLGVEFCRNSDTDGLIHIIKIKLGHY